MLLAWLVAATVPDAAGQSARTWRIGYLHPTDSDDVAYRAFRAALARLGYVVGGNTVLDARFAESKVDRLPQLASELVASRVDLIVAVSPTAIRAARAATSTIPIVMAFSGDDPVKSGFAQSLSRPGGNTTGLTTVSMELAPRWIALLRDLRPGLRAIAVLRSPGRPDHTAEIAVLAALTERLAIRMSVFEVRELADYAPTFLAMHDAGSEAVIVLPGPEFTRNRARLVEEIARQRLLSIHAFAEFAVAGGLVSYGPDIADLSARAATYVDRILKGADPATMPIEQPRKFFLTINRRAAEALGLRIPPALVLEADQLVD
jgi:putative ABC transport system substrate-binding protein